MVSKSSEAVISRPMSLSSSMFFLPSLSVRASTSAASARSLASASCARSRSLPTRRRRWNAIGAEERQPEQRHVAGVGPPGAIPRRQDGERVGGVAADLAGDVPRPDVEAVVAEAQVGEVASRLAAPAPTSRRRDRRAWSGTRSPRRRRTSAPRTRRAGPKSTRATGRRPDCRHRCTAPDPDPPSPGAPAPKTAWRRTHCARCRSARTSASSRTTPPRSGR